MMGSAFKERRPSGADGDGGGGDSFQPIGVACAMELQPQESVGAQSESIGLACDRGKFDVAEHFDRDRAFEF